MRQTFFGLAAAALYWTGVAGVRIDKARGGADHGDMLVVAGHRVLADVGNHKKNASSASQAKLRGTAIEFANIELRQAGGRCGSQYGRCTNDLCCSDYGYCGDSIDHCAPLFDCQPQYGVCGWPRAAAPTTTSAAPPPSTTSTSTSTSTTTSAPPPPVTTTSTTSTTSTSIRTTTTTSAPPPPSTTTTSAAPPTGTGGFRVTTNGMCGNGTMCIGSTQWGPCCSQFFWCGSTLEFCGAGCQSQFGACLGVPGQPGGPASNVSTTVGPTAPPSTSTSTTSTSTPIITQPPTTTSTTSTSTTTSARPTTTSVQLPPGMRSSTDGRCGDGVTCLGSTFGRCCSQFGFCGDGDQFCPPIVGCQPEFGTCDPGRS